MRILMISFIVVFQMRQGSVHDDRHTKRRSRSFCRLDDAPDKKNCRRSWVRFIHQVYEIDPLQCLKSGGQMKIIAFILEREEIIRILKHFSLGPIAYPEPATVDARVAPLDLKLLPKLSYSSNLK
jgi:hypothetical protein